MVTPRGWANTDLSPERGQLTFSNPSDVFDPSNPSEQKMVPAPENAHEWASWFQGHPNLNTSEPVPVRVGDAAWVRIDVTATSIPENSPLDYCGEQPCIPLFLLGREEGQTLNMASYDEFKDRFVIVDVEGETMVIDVAAPADEFDEFLPKAQKVLDAVEWRDPQASPSSGEDLLNCC
jgi:hypothetical protein